MKEITKITAVTRKNAMNGTFQTILKPKEVLEGNELAASWANFSQMERSRAKAMLTMLEGFILDALAKGHQLNFGLVTFYPRLSGALSSLDVDPETDGLYVRGAVKARRPLMNGLKGKIEAENRQSSIHARIFNVFDRDTKVFDKIAAGHVLSISGMDILFDPAQEDEGVWLERRTHKGNVRVARGTVRQMARDIVEVVFEEPIPSGCYLLAIYTRCGRGPSYRLIRCSHKVRCKTRS